MNRILVAYDGSELSEKALERAKAQIKLYPESELHVVTVVANTGPVTNTAVSYKIKMDIVESYEKELKYLKETYALAGMDIKTEIIIDNYHWNAGEKLCQYAKEHDINIIIVGSRGLGGLKKFFLGSVSSHVLKHADCEVLVVK